MSLIKTKHINTEKTLNALTVLLTIFLVVSISIQTFMGSDSGFNQAHHNKIEFWICIYFLCDFFILFCLSKDKKRFFLRYFPLIIFSIPYAYLLDVFSISVSTEMTYMLKFLPIVRGGVALLFLTQLVVRNKITGLFISYVFIFASLFYFQTLIFYIFEKGVNTEVQSYYDVLWWAAMTITTVGSTIIAQTAVGKLATTTLAVVGMTTLPIFTVYITSLVQRFNQTDTLSVAPSAPAASIKKIHIK
ncbi:hypothetical protein PAEH1_09080 [Paenalcaligenes hominis]|uniref:Potassium channel domain-containing protein n=1 Tax=Paenalcaligenes hominis TaxID=643674 RepID=A0A1U9K113_9BURK|nr:ion channel [Paenalcaligenes hominis]AQS51674.1 hypothetical protein PAEH1_09080 [Paenalcaligenes hominis]